jgi:hypothetical protein
LKARADTVRGTVTAEEVAMNFETPEADAAEQSQQVDERFDEDEPTTETPEIAPIEVTDADPADVAEQHRIVPDNDSYDRG